MRIYGAVESPIDGVNREALPIFNWLAWCAHAKPSSLFVIAGKAKQSRDYQR